MIILTNYSSFFVANLKYAKIGKLPLNLICNSIRCCIEDDNFIVEIRSGMGNLPIST